MGEDIDRERFGPADFHRFERRLRDGLLVGIRVENPPGGGLDGVLARLRGDA